MTPFRSKRFFWDYLPFWFVMACLISFMVFDVWAMKAKIWIYAPPQEIER